MIKKVCQKCNEDFNFRGSPSDVSSGRGKYCSNQCKLRKLPRTYQEILLKKWRFLLSIYSTTMFNKKVISLKQKIIKHLYDNLPNWIHKGELGRLAVNEWGYENENMGRRCRELENSGRIDKMLNEKGEVMYRYHKQTPEEREAEERQQLGY